MNIHKENLSGCPPQITDHNLQSQKCSQKHLQPQSLIFPWNWSEAGEEFLHLRPH